MAHVHARGHSQSISSAPHAVSLKVLRLSRPSLTVQHPLPQSTRDEAGDGLTISPLAGLAVPVENGRGGQLGQRLPEFTLTPALTLPSSFASAYVGENFACLLSANNETVDDQAGGENRVISKVKITTEMQTPSNPAGSALPLADGAGNTQDSEEGSTLGTGESVQRIVQLDLKEEGNHILAVTVTYTETQRSSSGTGEGEALSPTTPTAGPTKTRTFRKLYQFVAQQLLSVRTKTGTVPHGDGQKPASAAAEQYVLEAQLENVGQAAVCLERVELNPRAPFNSTSLNWDMQEGQDERHPARAPLLNPRDVMQVAFLLQPQDGLLEEKDADGADVRRLAEQQRIALGQLSIQWRGHMGDRGSLSTGLLSAKAR